MRNSLRAALVGVALVAVATPASATHWWGGYKWARTTTNLSLTVNVAVDGTWASYVDTAINSDWNNHSVLRLTGRTAPNGTNAKRCNPITGQILVCNDAYGQRGWLGIATITIDKNSRITSGTTKLNDSYFAYAPYNAPKWRAMVACQEIGHDFGLAHQDENFSNTNLGSCMDYTNDPAAPGQYGTDNQHPNQHDYDQLDIIYASTDSYTTVSGTSTNFGIREVGKPAPEALPAPGDSKAEWGSAIHRDGKGRPDQFMRKLPGGGLMLTHVLWTPDAKGTEAD